MSTQLEAVRARVSANRVAHDGYVTVKLGDELRETGAIDAAVLRQLAARRLGLPDLEGGHATNEDNRPTFGVFRPVTAREMRALLGPNWTAIVQEARRCATLSERATAAVLWRALEWDLGEDNDAVADAPELQVTIANIDQIATYLAYYLAVEPWEVAEDCNPLLWRAVASTLLRHVFGPHEYPEVHETLAGLAIPRSVFAADSAEPDLGL